MSQFNLVTAWGRHDAGQASRARAFWRTHALAEPQEVEDLVPGLCALACEGASVVGVATVSFRQHPPLRSRFAFCRCEVAPESRRTGLATLLVRHSLTVMEGWSLEHPEEQLNGLAVILKAPELDTKARSPVWSEFYGNLNLVGYSPQGGQIRVAWFRHAKLTP